MAEADVKWALNAFRDVELDRDYDYARNYYAGHHPMAFATDKFMSAFGDLFRRFADNLCPAVVDSVADRLQIVGFEAIDAKTGVVLEGSDELEQQAWAIWRRNKMPLRSIELHTESLLMGDGYMLVEASQTLDAILWSQCAESVRVDYSADEPGVVDRAAKLWADDAGYLRLNLYFRDRVERYISKRPTRGWLPDSYRDNDFHYLSELEVSGLADRLQPLDVQPNPWGIVPIVHFPNKTTHKAGISELSDVYPLQDALNKAYVDLLVTMEFAAFRQRWAVGIGVDEDPATGQPIPPPFASGVDRVWVSTDPDTRFGSFDSADLNQFLQVQEATRSEIARVTGLPLHLLFITKGDFPSGEAMKSAEARFSKKLVARQNAYGEQWAHAMALALAIEGHAVPDDVILEPVWTQPQPRSELEIAETELLKKTLGVPLDVVMKELGYPQDVVDQAVAAAAAQAVVAAAPNGRNPAGAPAPGQNPAEASGGVVSTGLPGPTVPAPRWPRLKSTVR